MRPMRVVGLVSPLLVALPAGAQEYDLLLRNARVVDEGRLSGARPGRVLRGPGALRAQAGTVAD